MPKSAYMFFAAHHMRQFKKQSDEANTPYKTTDVAKQIGDLWNKTPDSDKVSYEQMHQNDIKR